MALSRAIFQYLGRWPGKSRATIPCQRCPVFQLLMRMKATAKRVRCPVRDSFFLGGGLPLLTETIGDKPKWTEAKDLSPNKSYHTIIYTSYLSTQQTYPPNRSLLQNTQKYQGFKKVAICHPLGTWAAPGIPHRSNLSMEAMKPKPWETLASAPRRSRYVQGAWDTFWI